VSKTQKLLEKSVIMFNVLWGLIPEDSLSEKGREEIASFVFSFQKRFYQSLHKDIMNEIIKKWQQFMAEWAVNPANISQIFDEKQELKKMILKPSFYDFMEWLSKSRL